MKCEMGTTRCYAVALCEDGTVVRTGSMFSVGEEVDLGVMDARVECRVEGVRGLPADSEDE